MKLSYKKLISTGLNLVTALAILGFSPKVMAESQAPSWGDTDIRILPLVTLENHGSFRLRFNLFSNMDLGLGADPTLNPHVRPRHLLGFQLRFVR